MTTRRQRERQERYRRHGVERPVAPQREQKAQREGDEAASPAKKGGRGKSQPRGRKPVPYPTLRRCLIRAPIFGFIWFGLITLVLSQGQPPLSNLLQAMILTVVMIPLLFMTDMLTYRLAKRRDLPVQERPQSGYLGFGG